MLALVAKIYNGAVLLICIIHFPYCSFHMLIQLDSSGTVC